MREKTFQNKKTVEKFKMSEAAWSSFYNEATDFLPEFDEHIVIEPNTPGSARQFSDRQITGQFEVDVGTAKDWEEDWEDEDPEDSLEHITSMIQAGSGRPAAK